ncbi:MAG: hypothetical protein IIW01_11090 [Thermoguttaceae bacterium]|nr:hypothetical protein [Thermoguttaceae bacterium]
MQFLDALFGKTQRSKFWVATALLGGSVFGLGGGCATPFYSTDNKILLHFPGAARRSDQIPGVLRPWERVKLIEEKGEKGAKAPAEEKDVLLLQISQEFENSASPNVRRASIEAIAKISRNYSNPVAENIFRVALEDNELNLAVSAADGLGVYALDVQGGAPESRRLAVELLADKYKRLPFSIAAGSEEENMRRKDLRSAILRNLANFQESDSPLVFETLELGLTGEKLDDGALQDAAMRSLAKITGEKYGLDAELWLQFLAYSRGEASKPSAPSITARAPKLDAAIFK